MTYKNKATGFVFSTDCKIKAEGWDCLDPQPTISAEAEEKKTKLKKRNKNDDELCDNG